METKVLRLNLKAQWYNMIESGVKKAEYRELKSYWIQRLFLNKENEKMSREEAEHLSKHKVDFLMMVFAGTLKPRNYTHVEFVYGYTRRTMMFELNDVNIGFGKKEWGAPDNDCFIIKLGNRLK